MVYNRKRFSNGYFFIPLNSKWKNKRKKIMFWIPPKFRFRCKKMEIPNTTKNIIPMNFWLKFISRKIWTLCQKNIGRLGEGKKAFLLDQYCNMYCSEGCWNKKSMKYNEKKNTNMNNVLNRWEVKNDLPLFNKSINPRADRTTTAIFEKRMQSAAINPNFNQVKKSLWSFVMR